ncbi:tetratricopeptide repeat protein [Sphingomonas arenae]|uniref:tetratricopeptide repeat protein n=1 Tax=Sphingomonas arenae TaxID=2812555 RepID=UPI0019686E01|nr:tetratricopeptide repeat protein [Sphingomonas arenae]
MTFKSKALGLALSLCVAGFAVPSAAQQEAPKPLKVSNEAGPAIRALDTAVKGGDFSNLPALLAEANAKAKTADDRFAIVSLQLRAAQAQNDKAATAAAVDGLLATGRIQEPEASKLRFSAAQLRYELKQYDQAAAGFEQALAADPNNLDAYVLLAETRKGQNREAEAVPLLQKAIQLRAASGQPVPESWYNRATALAFNNKLPSAPQLARDWAKAYPSPTSWRTAIMTFEPTSGLTGPDKVDIYRLQRAAGALKGETDYYRYADAVLLRGLPGEAKAVLEEGFAANAIDRNKPAFRDLYAAASAKIAADKAGLVAAEKSALASPAARSALGTGDALMSYGDYQKAAALYRAALGKSGVDAGAANLRLGIALARAGDTASATAAFNAVTGPRAGLAKLWLDWLSSRR